MEENKIDSVVTSEEETVVEEPIVEEAIHEETIDVENLNIIPTASKPRKIKNMGDGKKSTKYLLMIGSVAGILLIWYLCELLGWLGPVFKGPREVFGVALPQLLSKKYGGSEDLLLLKDIYWSLSRVLGGWALAFCCAIPVAFLMAWNKTFRHLADPWIQFFRTIPPIALIPLVILLVGIGEDAKIAVIFVTSFLVMVVTVYQGVKNMDQTLLRAAYTLGADDLSIFFKVVVPNAFPFILVAARLGVSTALTTLVAAEMTGTFYGLGSRIQTAQIYFRMDIVLLGIICIGVIGFILDRLLLLVEKKLTKWQ